MDDAEQTTMDFIDHQRDSMQPDEWLSYLEELFENIKWRIKEAKRTES